MRPLHATLERRLRRADPSARLLVEIDEIEGAKIVDTPDEWNDADSLTGIEVRPDGAIRLDGTQTTLVSTLPESTAGATFITDLNRVTPFVVALFSVEAGDPFREFDQIVAHLDPDPAGTGRIVDQWVCELWYVFQVEDRSDGSAPVGPLVTGDILHLIRMAGPVYVVEDGTADHEVTFNFSQFAQLSGRPIASGAAYPSSTFVVMIRAIKNDGTTATNVEWQTTNVNTFGSTTKLYSVMLDQQFEHLTQRPGGYRITGGGMDVPLVKVGYFTFTNDAVEFVANPLDAGADPTSNSLVRLFGHARVLPGTAVRFYVRNDADNGWVQYTHQQRATDLANVDFTGAGHPRKFRVELDTNATGDVTPEVLAIGFQYVTATLLHDVADVESWEAIVNPSTLQGRIQEIRIRGFIDGVHDFNSAIEELLATHDIADLAISLYIGHPDDDRSTWTLINTFPIIDDIEHDGHSHVLIGVCPLAFLRGGPTGERRLPRYDTVAEEREELLYDGTTLNTPSEIWHDLITVQLAVSPFWVGAPPENVTIVYLDEAGASQSLDFSVTTGLKKRIADSDGHAEVDAIGFVSGHATISTRGKIRAVRVRGGEGPVRAIFTADEITWAQVSPGFRHRRPVLFTEYNFWDSPDDPDEVRSFHQNAIDNLGGGRIEGVERIPEGIGSWIALKAIAEAVGAREIAAFGTGRMEWSFESMYSYPELELGDRIAVEVDRFAAKDPNVARELRGALWAVGRIVGVHNAWHTRFTLWIENWADIIASAKVVTRTNLDELGRVKVYNTADLVYSGTASLHLLTWDAEQVDTTGFHSTSTNTNRLTIPPGWGGVYSAAIHLPISNYAQNYELDIMLRRNGLESSGNWFWKYVIPTTHPARGVIDASVPAIELLAGDYLELRVASSGEGSSVTITFEGGNDNEAWFELRRVPPIRAVAASPQARRVGSRF